MSTEEPTDYEEEVIAAIGAFLLLDAHEGMGPYGKIAYAAPAEAGLQVTILDDNER